MNRYSLPVILSLFMVLSCTDSPTDNNQSIRDKASTFSRVSSRLINFKTALNSKFFSASSGESYYYAEIKASEYDIQTRSPLNISLVIDRSGSMFGEKLNYAKEAAKFVVNNLSDSDYVSLVIYDDDVNVLFPSALAANKDHLRTVIDRIESDGSTNLSGGMLQGYDEVKSTHKSGYVNRVLLLSDGLANEGIVDETRLKNIVRSMNIEENISLSTFGLGEGYNEDLMLSLAEYGSGNYYFISSPEEVPSIFEKELDGLLSIVAQNLILKIDLPRGAKVTNVMGFKDNMTRTRNNLTFNLRDIASLETKSLVLVIEPPRNMDKFEITSTLSFDDVADNRKRITETLVNAMSKTQDSSLVSSHQNDTVLGQYTLFLSNALLTKSMEAVDKRDYKAAENLISENKKFLKKADALKLSFSDLKTQDSLVLEYDKNLEEVKAMNDIDRKLYQKSNKSRNYKLRKKKK